MNFVRQFNTKELVQSQVKFFGAEKIKQTNYMQSETIILFTKIETLFFNIKSDWLKSNNTVIIIIVVIRVKSGSSVFYQLQSFHSYRWKLNHWNQGWWEQTGMPWMG